MAEDKLETIILDSWAALNYRAKEWGAERIVFDAVSNHFPEDSGGSQYWVKFYQENQWVPLEEYNPNKDVKKIVMYDNGKGYPYIYTILCYSSKHDKETATGQFGEGLKMISAAAIRNGIDLEFGSRDWRAKPFAKKITIDYNDDEMKKIEVLCQEVTIGHPRYYGSFTMITEPNQEIIDQVLSFRDRIIDFREDIKYRINLNSRHRVFCPEKNQPGELFIKRIKYGVSKPLLLTYQMLGSAANTLLTPDRNHVIEHRLDTQLSYIISLFDNVNLIKTFLSSARDCYEGNLTISPTIEPAHPEAWVEAFLQLYGEKAVLEDRSDESVNSNAENIGFKVVKSLPTGLHIFLFKAGIPSATQNVSYDYSWHTVFPEELNSKQIEIYNLHKRINELLIPKGRSIPEIHIFSKAMRGLEEATWFLGMANWDNEVEKIYIRLNQLESPQQFCATYGHEVNHILSKSADITRAFENKLTESLGKTLYSLITETE